MAEFQDSKISGDSSQEESKELNEQQKRAFDAVVHEKQSIYLTGPGGTGKSHIINKICSHMNEQNENYLLLSTTGISACNLKYGGETVYSVLKLGLGQSPINEIRQKMIIGHKRFCCSKKNENTDTNVHTSSVCPINRIKKAQLLILDEVSMLPGRLLYSIHRILQWIRNDRSLFGGICTLFVGDFFQLCPIFDGPLETPEFLAQEEIDPIFKETNGQKYVFQTSLWNELIQNDNVHYLEQSFRQKDDALFLEILNRMRLGQLTPNDASVLMTRQIGETEIPSHAVCLFSHVKTVNSFNERKLQSCPFPEITTHIYIDINVSQSTDEEENTQSERKLRNDFLQEKIGMFLKEKRPSETFTFRRNARIMLINNLSIINKLFNGRMGFIRNVGHYECPADETLMSSIVPEAFVQVMSEEELLSQNEWNWQANDNIVFQVEFDSFHDSADNMHWICANKVKQEYKHIGSFELTQFPFQLAWAVTIHKSQSQTLTSAVIDMQGIFEHGQAYTAFSRVTSLEGLFILNPDMTRFFVDPPVMEWELRTKNISSEKNLQMISFHLNLSDEQKTILRNLPISQVIQLLEMPDLQNELSSNDIATLETRIQEIGLLHRMQAGAITAEEVGDNASTIDSFKNKTRLLLQANHIGDTFKFGGNKKLGDKPTNKCILIFSSNDSRCQFTQESHSSMIVCLSNRCYFKCNTCTQKGTHMMYDAEMKRLFKKL
jgi:hypothetical protein